MRECWHDRYIKEVLSQTQLDHDIMHPNFTCPDCGAEFDMMVDRFQELYAVGGCGYINDAEEGREEQEQ